MNKKINPPERVALLAAVRTHILSGSLLFNYTAMLKEIKQPLLSLSLFFFVSPEQFVIFPLHIHTLMFFVIVKICLY